MNPVDGYTITIGETGHPHTVMIREGCSGSPNCALEFWAGRGSDYTGGVNLHLSDREVRKLYRAVKAVRRARRTYLEIAP